MFVRVRVEAGARREIVRVEKDGRLAIWVRADAERNAANKRVCALVAAHCGVSEKAVRIIAGHRSQNKLLEVVQ